MWTISGNDFLISDFLFLECAKMSRTEVTFLDFLVKKILWKIIVCYRYRCKVNLVTPALPDVSFNLFHFGFIEFMGNASVTSG